MATGPMPPTPRPVLVSDFAAFKDHHHYHRCFSLAALQPSPSPDLRLPDFLLVFPPFGVSLACLGHSAPLNRLTINPTNNDIFC